MFGVVDRIHDIIDPGTLDELWGCGSLGAVEPQSGTLVLLIMTPAMKRTLYERGVAIIPSSRASSPLATV